MERRRLERRAHSPEGATAHGASPVSGATVRRGGRSRRRGRGVAFAERLRAQRKRRAVGCGCGCRTPNAARKQHGEHAQGYEPGAGCRLASAKTTREPVARWSGMRCCATRRWRARCKNVTDVCLASAWRAGRRAGDGARVHHNGAGTHRRSASESDEPRTSLGTQEVARGGGAQ